MRKCWPDGKKELELCANSHLFLREGWENGFLRTELQQVISYKTSQVHGQMQPHNLGWALELKGLAVLQTASNGTLGIKEHFLCLPSFPFHSYSNRFVFKNCFLKEILKFTQFFCVNMTIKCK